MEELISLRNRRRARRGFSLIEILIVMIMVGALLAVALPRVGRQISRDRAQRSAMVVQGILEEASQIASRVGTPVTITYSSGVLSIQERDGSPTYRSRRFGSGQDLKATVTMNPSVPFFAQPPATSFLSLVLVSVWKPFASSDQGVS